MGVVVLDNASDDAMFDVVLTTVECTLVEGDVNVVFGFVGLVRNFVEIVVRVSAKISNVDIAKLVVLITKRSKYTSLCFCKVSIKTVFNDV